MEHENEESNSQYGDKMTQCCRCQHIPTFSMHSLKTRSRQSGDPFVSCVKIMKPKVWYLPLLKQSVTCRTSSIPICSVGKRAQESSTGLQRQSKRPLGRILQESSLNGICSMQPKSLLNKKDVSGK